MGRALGGERDVDDGSDSADNAGELHAEVVVAEEDWM
jgi:hypothetical protein